MRKINLFGKSIPLALILVIAVVGTIGTAATLSYFGTVTGEVNVDEQAVEVEGDTTFTVEDYSGYGEATTKNNIDREVSYQWETTDENIMGSGESDSDAAEHAVFKVQEFEMEELDDGFETPTGETFPVTVKPAIDQVTYRVELPEDYFTDHSEANADLQISDPHSHSETNYHIKYSSDSHTSDGDYNWIFYKPSLDKSTTIKGESNVLDRPEIKEVYANENGGWFEVTVAREYSEDQSFAVSASAGGGANTYQTKDFSYEDEDASSHLVPDFTDQIGETNTVAPNGENDYVISAYLWNDFDGENYDYKFHVGVEPEVDRD